MNNTDAKKLIDIEAFTKAPYDPEFAEFREVLWGHLEKRLIETKTLRASMAAEMPSSPKAPTDPILLAKHARLLRRVAIQKRVIDLVGGFFLLLLMSLPMAVISLVIWLRSPGPVIVKALRVGQDGQEFMMFRFRTTSIVPPPDKCYGTYLDNYASNPVGDFLLRSNLNQFPELINVLKGDMSLVGPTPRHPWIYEQIKKQRPRAVEVLYRSRPGMTGEAQVWCRFRRRLLATQDSDAAVPYFLNYLLRAEVRLELRYIKRHSLKQDLKLAWTTLRSFGLIFRPKDQKISAKWQAQEGDLKCIFGTRTPSPKQVTDYLMHEDASNYPWPGGSNQRPRVRLRRQHGHT